MNNQLQTTWVQPCEEITPISKTRKGVALKKRIQKIWCQINKSDRFSTTLNSSFSSRDQIAQKGISRNILR